MSILALASCGNAAKTSSRHNGFPAVNQAGKTAIVAHRGFWNCEEAGFSENSIASLKAAQDNGFWGSEFDIGLTADSVVIVNHDNTIDGLRISKTPWSVLQSHLLPNGERRPLLEEYIEQGAKCSTTMLICEFKPQGSDEMEDVLVDKTFEAFRERGMMDPGRVAFISFSRHISERVAALAPQFINQYLNGELSPSALSELGINGWDYHQSVAKSHSNWVAEAKSLGMSTNVWTVNRESDIRAMAELHVDAITTNEPLLAREILGSKEFKKDK